MAQEPRGPNDKPDRPTRHDTTQSPDIQYTDPLAVSWTLGLQQTAWATEALLRDAAQFDGPLPHPRHLAAYEVGMPGSADTLVALAIAEQKHRHRTELLEIAYPYLGLFLGATTLAGCVAGAVFLGMTGHDTLGLALLGIPVLGAVGWLINTRIGHRRSSEAS